MAKESMKAREVKRAKMVAKYAAKRAALKKIVNTSDDPQAAFEAAVYPSQCQPHPPAQSLRDHGTSQRLHPPLRSLSYPIPRNGFGWLDSRCSQGFLVSIGTFKRNSFFI